MDVGLGYTEERQDADGIIRARTGSIRSWDFPRKLKVLESIKKEFQTADYPGVYLLFQGEKEVYVGEAKSVYDRLHTHATTPEEKIKNWERAIIINDGRSSTQSDFNDAVIRKTIESYLIRLFRLNKYRVLAQGEPQKHNAAQRATFELLRPQIDFLLLKKGMIDEFDEQERERLVLNDELLEVIDTNGYTVSEWSAKNATINGLPAFIRPCSKKPNGWQITIRGRKESSFITSLTNGKGFLVVPRGNVFVIPLSEVLKVIDKSKLDEQDTIDIWLNFDRDKTILRYMTNAIDVTKFSLKKQLEHD